jgi:hypothetical protein
VLVGLVLLNLKTQPKPLARSASPAEPCAAEEA